MNTPGLNTTVSGEAAAVGVLLPEWLRFLKEVYMAVYGIAVILGFLVLVVYSKHLHILFSLPNVALARRPRALGALLPVYSGGKAVDFDDPGEDDLMGVGKVEDFLVAGREMNLHLGIASLAATARRASAACPSWSAPIVGTSPTSAPPRPASAARSSALVRVTITAPSGPATARARASAFLGAGTISAALPSCSGVGIRSMGRASSF